MFCKNRQSSFVEWVASSVIVGNWLVRGTSTTPTGAASAAAEVATSGGHFTTGAIAASTSSATGTTSPATTAAATPASAVASTIAAPWSRRSARSKRMFNKLLHLELIMILLCAYPSYGPHPPPYPQSPP